MKLVQVSINGYRRICDTRLLVRSKILALVGPNEAGKSSLLAAIEDLSKAQPVDQNNWPMNKKVTSTDIASEAKFLIEEHDWATIGESNRNTPRFFIRQKQYGGEILDCISPDSATSARRAETLRGFKSFSKDSELTEEVNSICEILEIQFSKPPYHLTSETLSRIQGLVGILKGQPRRELRNFASLAEMFMLAEEEQSLEDVEQAEKLSKRYPWFFQLTEEERTLKAEYDLSLGVDKAPASLVNLAALAGFNLKSLRSALESQDFGLVATILEPANEKLKAVFSMAWQQYPMKVLLQAENLRLRILVSGSDGRYGRIAERSDGLQAFVALAAFAAWVPGDGRSIVLLIDEVEQHLHYDAQADMIQMLERQEIADIVLYSTHSAGSRPSDLGTGVAAIIPEKDTLKSVVDNCVWSGPGFTPMLMAMGASVMAFTPTRYAVIAEGPTEAILLPTLLRKATGRTKLGYQIAPGLAEASKAQASKLSLEAARVVYLVDGDSAGNAIRKKLLNAGVSEDLIFTLGGSGSGFTLEDLLDESRYCEAVNLELERRQGTRINFSESPLPPMERSSWVEKWCKEHGVHVPSKTAIASIVLELHDGVPYLNKSGLDTLRSLDVGIRATLGVPAVPS